MGVSERVTAAIARGKRPVTFRTRKLRLSAPMVLQGGPCGRVGHRRTPIHDGHPEMGGHRCLTRGSTEGTGRPSTSTPVASAMVRVRVVAGGSRAADPRPHGRVNSTELHHDRRGTHGRRSIRPQRPRTGPARRAPAPRRRRRPLLLPARRSSRRRPACARWRLPSVPLERLRIALGRSAP